LNYFCKIEGLGPLIFYDDLGHQRQRSWADASNMQFSATLPAVLNAGAKGLSIRPTAVECQSVFKKVS
jgi:hypothetical protein